jgi:hypothetical protein
MIALIFLAWLFGVVAIVAAIRAEECWFGNQYEMFKVLQNTCTVLCVVSMSVALLWMGIRWVWPR